MTDKKLLVHAACFAVGLVVMSTAGVAWAQSAANPKQVRARELFEQAVQFSEQGKWSDACPRFQEAHDLYTTGGTTLQLANCYEQLGEIAKAYDLYVTILLNKANEKYPERLKIAYERAAALRKRIKDAHEASVQALPDEPDATKPSVPGPPRYEMKNEGKQMPATGEPSDPPAVQALPAGEPSRLPAAIAFGVGGVGLVVGTVFGVMALSQHASVVDSCNNGMCPANQQPEQDAAMAKAWVSNVGFAVGAVGIAVGVVLLVVQGRKANSGTQAAYTFGPVRVTSPGTFSVRF